MAHASCNALKVVSGYVHVDNKAFAFVANGHDMWNGDGKPVVEAFRIEYLREYTKAHPECRLYEDPRYWQLYDCVHNVPGEDLDCWYSSMTFHIDTNYLRKEKILCL